MSPLVVTLNLTDFAVIAVIVIGFVSAASLATRQRINLRRVERKLDALLQHHNIALPSKLSPEVQRLASVPGQKIAAIKLHREQAGLSLAEAKAEVEDFGH